MISTHFQPVDVCPSSQYFPGYHPALLAHFSWEITASRFCTPVMYHRAPDSWTTQYGHLWVQEQLLCHLLLLHIWVYTAATLVFHTTYTWLSHFQGNPQTWAENELWADKLPWQLLVPNHCPLWIALVFLWSEKLTCTHHIRDLPVKLGARQRLTPPKISPRSSFFLSAGWAIYGWLAGQAALI